jgi:hypothetical protein
MMIADGDYMTCACYIPLFWNFGSRVGIGAGTVLSWSLGFSLHFLGNATVEEQSKQTKKRRKNCIL